MLILLKSEIRRQAIVLDSRNHCCSGNTRMHSVCAAELHAIFKYKNTVYCTATFL
jgi:hypothetical protein